MGGWRCGWYIYVGISPFLVCPAGQTIFEENNIKLDLVITNEITSELNCNMISRKVKMLTQYVKWFSCQDISQHRVKILEGKDSEHLDEWMADELSIWEREAKIYKEFNNRNTAKLRTYQFSYIPKVSFPYNWIYARKRKKQAMFNIFPPWV